VAVAQDTYIGNTHIIIKDDFIVSLEEQQKILKRCGEIAARQYGIIAKKQPTDDKTA
jgi:hypothetical protein